MKTASAVILCLAFTKTYSLCTTTFTTVCDSLSDVKDYGNKSWLDLTIGDIRNERAPNETLEGNIFDNCPNVEELTIIETVRKVNTTALTPLKKLVVLNLYKNSIRILSDINFAFLPKLTRLDLQWNNIQQIISEGPILDSMYPYLKIVYLSHNKLRRLSQETFKVRGLRRLDMAHNYISEIKPASIFSKDLHYLNLDNNRLNHIPAEVFEGMDNLKQLVLSNNQFTILRIKYSLPSLHTLDLSHNNISIVQADFFDLMPNLGRIYLNHNLIKSFPANMFGTNFNNLKITTLHLHYNRLNSNLQFLMKRKWEELYVLTLAGNPWPCSCLDSMLTTLESIGLKLDLCEEGYFTRGSFPICIDVAVYKDGDKCIYSDEPAESYDMFLNTPKLICDYVVWND